MIIYDHDLTSHRKCIPIYGPYPYMAQIMDYPQGPSLNPPILPSSTLHIPPHDLNLQNHPLEPSTPTPPHKCQIFQKWSKITHLNLKIHNFCCWNRISYSQIIPPSPILPVLTHFHPFHPFTPLTLPPIIHNTHIRKWVGHLWVYHNFDVDIFKMYPRGEEISLWGNFTFTTMIEFDGLPHHMYNYIPIRTLCWEIGLKSSVGHTRALTS